MKKPGFTLVEVLIALAIIGVVAAMTLPTLVSEHQKDVWANSLSVAVSDFERAMGAMIMRDGVNDLTETEAWKYALEKDELYSSSENIEGFVKNIKQVLKVDDKYKNPKEMYQDVEVKHFDGTIVESDDDAFMVEPFTLVGKADIAYHIAINWATGYAGSHTKESDVLALGGNLYKTLGVVHIDVNGNKKPNVWGKDIFTFYLDIDGILYPFGGKDYSVWKGGDSYYWKKACSDTNKGDGRFCTGRLIENGYKMDY